MANSKEGVDAIIANEILPFTNEDAKWLQNLEGEAFSRIFNYECQCPDAKKYNTLVEEYSTTVEKYEALTKEKTALEEKLTANESKSKEKENHIPTFEEVVNSAPVDMQEALQDGMRMSKAKRSKLIDALVANTRSGFTKEELEGKKTQELEKLVALGNIPVDHSLKGNGGEKVYGPNEKHPDGSGVPLVQRFEDWGK